MPRVTNTPPLLSTQDIRSPGEQNKFLPPVKSTYRPITIEDLISSSLGAEKLEICSVMLSGVYKPTKPEKKISVGRKIYNIKRAIAYHSRKDHRDDILKIYYTRLLAQYSDGENAIQRATEMLKDEEKFHSTTLFSTLLLDVVELQAHFNLIHCINDFQAFNHPSNLQLKVRQSPTALHEVIEILPFPRDLLAKNIQALENTRFRVYTNIYENLPYLYSIEQGATIDEVFEESIKYKELPKGHVLTYDYGKLPYSIRAKATRSEVADYCIRFDSHRLFETYKKISPWTNTISESAIARLNCVDRFKLSVAGVRNEMKSCKDNICICKTAIYRRMQLVGGCNDLDYQKLTATYRFCAYAVCLEQVAHRMSDINLNLPSIPLTLSKKVIPWHLINRGSII